MAKEGSDVTFTSASISSTDDPIYSVVTFISRSHMNKNYGDNLNMCIYTRKDYVFIEIYIFGT